MEDNRNISILEELLNADNPVTSDDLALIHKVSSRTIRNDIQILNNWLKPFGAQVKSLKGKGFQLDIIDEKMFNEFIENVLKMQSIVGEVTPNQRINYLIKRLLLNDAYLKLDNLADEMFISKSSLQNDLRTVKTIFSKYDITLEIKPYYGFRIKGDETRIRYCMAEYVFDQKNTNFINLCEKFPTLKVDEILKIKSIIINNINKYKMTLSDIAIKNLTIHIAIACERIKMNNYIHFFKDEYNYNKDSEEHKVASAIVNEVEEYLSFIFSLDEISYITMHLLGNKVVPDKEKNDLIPDNIKDLTFTILKQIDKNLGLDISGDQDLFDGISLHLKPAINRLIYHMNIRNPMLSAIKSNYPVAFEAAIVAGNVIKDKLSIDINENELGYLALHIEAALERRKLNTKNPKKCIIVCASGTGSSQLLYYKLKARLGDSIEIVGTTELYKLNQFNIKAIDFIISTVDIKENISVPVFVIDTILNKEAIDRLELALFHESSSAKKYIHHNLIFLQKEFNTKEEVIAYLCNRTYELGLTEKDFLSSVLDREYLASTSYGNLVAVPHAMSPQSEKTFWAVCTLKKPIIWEKEKVQFILLLSVKRNTTENLEEMYNFLLSIIDNKQLVNDLIKSNTIKEFLHFINS